MADWLIDDCIADCPIVADSIADWIADCRLPDGAAACSTHEDDGRFATEPTLHQRIGNAQSSLDSTIRNAIGTAIRTRPIRNKIRNQQFAIRN